MNAVVQDANKVGTGMRTIALRLTGTKSAKDELEEMGEETENVITSQSKLRDVIKEATAVASNGYKGFDILNENGNYKSTYEIMLSIAEIYNEILETDKKLGRNNANLLLENVAGKVRANIAASIFQNPQLLKDAYMSSQEADNSAMKENEKYMQSISGHLAKLKNAWQEMWANTANRDTVNFFIDIGKSLIEIVNTLGVVPTTLAAIVLYLKVIKAGTQGSTLLNIIDALVVDLVTIEGRVGDISAGLVNGISKVRNGFSSILPVIGGVGSVIAVAGMAAYAWVKHQERVKQEMLDTARAAGQTWQEQNQALSNYISQYEELKTKLNSGTLSEQETLDVKQQILDIQKNIVEQYGSAADNVDLINNKLEDQVALLNDISKAEANRVWNSENYQEAFEIAKEAMTSEKEYPLDIAFKPNYDTPEDTAFTHIIQKYTQERSEISGSGDLKVKTDYRTFVGDNYDADKRILKAIDEIETLQKQYPNNKEFQKTVDKYLKELRKHRDSIEKDKENYEDIWLRGLSTDLARGGEGSSILSAYEKSVSDLETAYLENDTKKIREARYAYEDATKAKNDFLKIEGNDQFAILFDNINTSLIDNKIKAQDTIAIFKQVKEEAEEEAKGIKNTTKAAKKFSPEETKIYNAAKKLKDLNLDRVDIEGWFENNAYAGGAYTDVLNDLLNALDMTTDQSADLTSWLVEGGIVQGNLADATDTAQSAFHDFSNTIADAINNVSTLNTVMSESVSGASIAAQNIDQFKQMFGDDYAYALERSANGYHINAEKLQTLIDKQNALTNSDYQKVLDAQYDALKKCNDEIVRMNNSGQNVDGLIQQRAGILQRIQDTKDLMMTYEAATSAFQTWINAQSNGNEYDMYDKIANGYDEVKDLVDRGWSGDDRVRSYLDLTYGDFFDAFTASGEKCAEMFDNLDKKIEGTSYSIHDFFQFDSSGKITSNGIFNFFDALKEKQEQLGLSDDEKWIKDDGTYNFGFGRDRAAADQLGIGVEFFQSMLRAAVSAGFELNLDQPMWAMDELRDKAIKAQEELGGFNDIDFEELYNNLDDEDAYETISGHIDDLYDYIQKIEDSDLSPELKTQKIEQAQDMLSYLVALEREVADKGDIDLKATVVGSAKEELGKLIEETDELPEALKQYNWDEITDKDGLQKARNYIAAEIEGGRIDSSSAEAFLNILDQALYELNLIDEYEANPTLEGNTVGAFNDVKQAREELEKYIADAQQLEKDYHIKFNFAEDEEVKKLLSTIYGEGTPEILASLGIDSDKTPEEIIEMLESGERDLDVILKPDSSELEEKIETANQQKVFTHRVSSAANDIVNKTTNIVEEQTNQTVNTSMDTSSYDEGANHVEETKKKLVDGDTNVKVGMDKKPFDQGSKETENKVSFLDKLGAFPSVTLSGIGQVVNGSETIKSSIDSIKGKTISVTANFISNGLSALQGGIQSAINKARELMNTHIHFANGTAHFQGTAFSRGSIVSSSAYAGGKWGLPNDQTALTGELGTEIVVRDGNWFTVGDNGAEFVNLKKGDINKIVSIYSDVYKINHLIAGNP